MRKVVTAKVVEVKGGSLLIVICDDGAVFNFDFTGSKWESWPAIPGTSADDG